MRPGIWTPPRAGRKPQWPYELNLDSQQAQGLKFWYPFAPFGLSGSFLKNLVPPHLNSGAPNSTALVRTSNPILGSVINFLGATGDWIDLGFLNFNPSDGRATTMLWLDPGATNGSIRLYSQTSGGSNVDGAAAIDGDDSSADDVQVWNGANSLWRTMITQASAWTEETHLVGLQYSDTDGELKGFYDGLEDQNPSGVCNFDFGGANLGLGVRLIDSFGNAYDGRMGEFRIYEGHVPAQVHYQAWNPPTRWDLYWSRRRFYSFPASAAAAAGQPTMRRWGGVPHMGGMPTGRRSW